MCIKCPSENIRTAAQEQNEILREMRKWESSAGIYQCNPRRKVRRETRFGNCVRESAPNYRRRRRGSFAPIRKPAARWKLLGYVKWREGGKRSRPGGNSQSEEGGGRKFMWIPSIPLFPLGCSSRSIMKEVGYDHSAIEEEKEHGLFLKERNRPYLSPIASFRLPRRKFVTL